MGYRGMILLATMLPDSLLVVLRLVELLRTQHPDHCQDHILLFEISRKTATVINRDSAVGFVFEDRCFLGREGG